MEKQNTHTHAHAHTYTLTTLAHISITDVPEGAAVVLEGTVVGISLAVAPTHREEDARTSGITEGART